MIIHQPDVHENFGDDTQEIVEIKVDIVVFHNFSRIEDKPLESIHDHIHMMVNLNQILFSIIRLFNNDTSNC